MRTVCIGLLLFVSQAASPQQIQVAPPPSPARGPTDDSNVKREDKATLEGKIFSALTGEPLKKAHVTLRRMDSTTANAPPYGAYSDAAGHFIIEHVDPGRYHMSVDRSGYVRSDSSPKKLTTVPDTLTLTAGQRLTDLESKLMPQAVITGRVVDEDNEPVANAGVQCMRDRYVNGKKTLAPMANATTNDKGEYRAFGLAAGRYYVSATYVQAFSGITEIRSDVAPEEGYALTYYPSVIDPWSASQVTVAAGTETSSVDIRLVRSKTFLVAGRVTSPTSGVEIMLSKHGSVGFGFGGMKRVSADTKGAFILRGVLPGSYDLQAVQFSADQPRFAMSQVMVGDSNVGGLELAFGVPHNIEGVLGIENSPSQPQPAGADLSSYQISFYPDAGTPMYGSSGGQVKEDGAFTLKNVLPLNYRISVFPLQGDAYLKKIIAGERELLEGRLDFSSGIDAQEIRIVVSMNGAHLEGSVLDSKQEPSPHATVVLVPDRTDATQRYKSATTDQNGHYVLRGLTPGKYKLYALDQIDAGAFYDTEYMAAFESKAEALEVSEGSKLTHDLQLIVNDEMQ